MATKLMKLMDLPFPLGDLTKAMVLYADEALVYSTVSGTAFTVPSNTQIIGIGVRVTTAFAGSGPKLTITDTDNWALDFEGLLETEADRTMFVPVGKESNGNITYTITARGTLTAGACTVFVLYKMSTGAEPRHFID